MRIVQFFVVSVALIATICSGGIVVEQSEAEVSSYFIRAVIKVLTNCFANKIGNAVVFAGNTPATLLRTLSSENPIPAVVLNNTTRIAYNSMQQNQNRYKLQVFVVTASSMKQLEQLIREIKVTIWWNHMAHFFIIDWSSHDQCSEASKLLYKAWNQNIIRAKVMCLKRTTELQMYSYNPYTSNVPNGWQLDKIYTGKNFQSYTVFVRNYRDDDDTCEYLNFDVTQNLAGANFTVLSEKSNRPGHLGRGRYSAFVVEHSRLMMEMLCQSFNATPTDQFITESIYGFVDYRYKQGMPLFPVALHHPRPYGMRSYPYCQNQVIFMTQFRGHKSQLQKIISVMDIQSRIGICLVLLITGIFFKCFLRQSLMSAILNVIRILSDNGFVNLPQNTAPRLYLAALFFFAVTIQGIYQGQLACILTHVVPFPDAKSKLDLADRNYTIYVNEHNVKYFSDPIFDQLLVTIPGRDCSKYVLEDPMAACAGHLTLLLDQATEFKLHLGPEPIGNIQWAFVIPIDSPLEDRINKGLSRIAEGFLLLPYNKTWATFNLQAFEFDDEVKQNMVRRVMTLDDLGFAFVILGIGIALASVVFIFELIIGRAHSKVTTTQVQVLLEL